MDEKDNHKLSQPNPSRFQVSRLTLLTDIWMGRIIRVGGLGVVLAVMGMLAFLVYQVFPLFSSATVNPHSQVTFANSPVAFGEDEFGELPFTCDANGVLTFQNNHDGKVAKVWKPELHDTKVTTVRSYPREGLIVLGLSNGSVMDVVVSYKVDFDKKSGRTLTPLITAKAPQLIGKSGLSCLDVWSVKGPVSRLLIVRQNENGRDFLTGLRIKESKGLGGKARITSGTPFAIAQEIPDIDRVLVPTTADALLLISKKGEVSVYSLGDGDSVTLQQTFKPFADQSDSRIAAAGFIFGNVSTVFSSYTGAEVIWSIYPQKQPNGDRLRLWGKMHDGQPLAGPGQGIYPAVANKSYLTVAGGRMQIRNMTTDSIRWDGPATTSEIRQVAFSLNYDRLTILGADGILRRWTIEDHHTEASWKAFFGKIWYEGAEGPAYTWQSSSGSDEFEAKYSLVPLLYGTIKGTFYALLFAIPISILAAIYVSQFLRPELKKIVKPTMEIMASLPSVVLGFLAGLWLAPLVDANLVSILATIVVLAPIALIIGFIWSSFPRPMRRRIAPGWEFLYLLPCVFLLGWLAWTAGPWLESTFFTVKDTASGQTVSDLREWWRQNSGWGYDSRNSLVVGFVMGFAVIPIVFTIAEDALSNVPTSLISGSLALGASRWQTVRRVVIPTAISGIVSAIMIGFGRAVGETMIVVMATGNTAIMEPNPFNGMRTLSANIAVELPEAAVGHTHYRALFLGACCLFILTFIINTLAEVLRQRLRNRYKVV